MNNLVYKGVIIDVKMSFWEDSYVYFLCRVYRNTQQKVNWFKKSISIFMFIHVIFISLYHFSEKIVETACTRVSIK